MSSRSFANPTLKMAMTDAEFDHKQTHKLTYTLTLNNGSQPVDVDVIAQFLTVRSEHRHVSDRCIRHLIISLLGLQLVILHTRKSRHVILQTRLISYAAEYV